MADISTFTDLGGTTYTIKDSTARDKRFALDGTNNIPSGADLDDYKTPGNYTCANASTAGGIAHVPINAAFRMIVMRVVGSTTARFLQIVFPNTYVRFYMRFYGGSSWGAWRLFGDVANILGVTRESGMTGIANSYAVGDYVVVNESMYRVTAAVSAGGTLTEGTNVAATTVMGEIQRLASS